MVVKVTTNLELTNKSRILLELDLKLVKGNQITMMHKQAFAWIDKLTAKIQNLKIGQNFNDVGNCSRISTSSCIEKQL